MKMALWALTLATMLSCVDAKAPAQWAFSKEKVEEVKTSHQKRFYEYEISKAIDFGCWNEKWKTGNSDSLGKNPIRFQYEISKTLDLNNNGEGNDPEQERRQQRIQELIPQIKEPIILWDPTQPNVAITIDDWYWVESIKYMLDLFEEYDVKATFFVIWTCLKLHPKLWKRAAEQWHEICNHTMHHDKYFKTWNEAERFERELLWWEKVVKEVLWEDYLIKMKKNYPFFRFPWMYWIKVKAYLDILKKYGYIPIGWLHTYNPKDGVVNNGDIFLWHFKDQDKNNVKRNLDLIIQNGKHPMTVSNIITTDAYTEPIWWYNLYKKRNEVKNQVKIRLVKNNVSNKGYH